MWNWLRRMWFGLPPWKSDKERKMVERSKLSSLMRGLQDAVQDATAVAGQHNFHLLRALCDFEVDDDNRIKEIRPKVVKVLAPDGQSYLDVPLITLVNPAGYQLSELEIEMAVKMSLDAIKHCVEGKHDAERGSYSVEVCPKGEKGTRTDHVGLKLKFEATEPAEGMSRIIEELNNAIQSKRLPPSGPHDEVPTVPDHSMPDTPGALESDFMMSDHQIKTEAAIEPTPTVVEDTHEEQGDADGES